jgi:hypothetical protein
LKVYTCILLFFSFLGAMAQVKIQGILSDSTGAPVPFCAVALVKAADSTIIKGTLTSEDGKFTFQNYSSGTYRIKVKQPGYLETYSPSFRADSNSSYRIEPLVLKSNALKLEEVTVAVIKNPVEFKNGNIIVNVDGSPMAIGNSVYDLLARLPGVIVDGDNISIQGRNGVRFLIDDKMQQVSGPQLIALLRSISASSVDKIEILKNPPAKYDAAGGGLINIKTKKIKITGFSGNIVAMYSQGFYENTFDALTLNYKGRNFTVFSELNSGYSRYRQVNNWDRIVNFESKTTGINQHFTQVNTNQFFSASLGADYSINSRTSIGFRFDYRPGYEIQVRNGAADFTGDADYSKLPIYFAKPNTWYYYDYNINGEHQFDTNGTKLSFNCNYSDYPDYYQAGFENNFLDSEGNDVMPAKIFRTDNTVLIKILTGKLDFEKKISKSLSLETGVKANQVRMSSEFLFEEKDPVNGEYQVDSVFTNKFNYNENISAGYITLKKDLKKVNLQLGLRGENTLINTASRTSTIGYTRKYFNLFPVFSMDYNRSDNHHFQLSFNRRINRPDYNSFNPFRSFRSVLSSATGNPFLRPQYNNALELSHTFKGNISNAISWTRMDNYFLYYTIQNDSTAEATYYVDNLAHANNFSYSLFIRQDLYKWWNLTMNAVAYYFIYAGNVNDVYYQSAGFCSSGYMNNQFSLGKNTKLEVSGYVVGPWFSGVYHFKSRAALNLGLKQTFFKDKLVITAGVWDLFYSSFVRGYMDFRNLHTIEKNRWDSRRFYTSLTFNFGKVKVEKKRLDDEEKNRVKK